MIAEIIILIVAFLFLVLSIFLFNGKGKWLIAGYNTASKEEQKEYDEKKLCKGAGFICAVVIVASVVVAIKYKNTKAKRKVINIILCNSRDELCSFK